VSAPERSAGGLRPAPPEGARSGAQALRETLDRHRQLARDIAAVDEDLAQHHGLAWGDLVLLDLLQGAGGQLPAARAAEALGLTPTRLLRQVLPLEKLGLLRRGADPAGERGVALAAGGARLLREASDTAAGALALAGRAR